MVKRSSLTTMAYVSVLGAEAWWRHSKTFISHHYTLGLSRAMITCSSLTTMAWVSVLDAEAW